MGWLAKKLEKYTAPPGWRMTMGTSWTLTVALYVRDTCGLPATKPFHVPPMVPEVPGHIRAGGPTGDVELADEWAQWFGALMKSRAALDHAAGLLLEKRSPAFRQAVDVLLPEASAAAEQFKRTDVPEVHRSAKENGPVVQNVVLAVEKELGRKAVPFELEVRLLPVAGSWLHQLAPQRVLMSRGVLSDPAAMHRRLGPVIRELA